MSRPAFFCGMIFITPLTALSYLFTSTTASIIYIALSWDLKRRASCMAKCSGSTTFVAKNQTSPIRGFFDGIITNASRLVSGVLLLGWSHQALVQQFRQTHLHKAQYPKEHVLAEELTY
ncbi:hypothetical protein CNA03265 [Cryptococcus deneoformans JEC21]|uniref:Uncharacterized protein n=1 Tax=Cryptococcus deneoformans (strain JEC21 / ATCC MYA-565) TaxID=214684 RepID=A0A0S2LHY1_CRYD1|nr:hypothetical protein CNA03265 [Cryptococcus neoformans var. neoformans JEC21]ALO60320.1 hypothetical protein CNA03265 [Cryptococcus neoformans var. neoformans JEC21]